MDLNPDMALDQDQEADLDFLLFKIRKKFTIRKCWRSGSASGRIHIILLGPDPDQHRHPGHADPDPTDPDRCINSKHFSRKFQYDAKILTIMTILPLMRKKNHYKLALL
jgi:hypothetical protein